MDAEAFLKKNIYKELTSQGFSDLLSQHCTNEAVDHFRKTAKFSGPAYLQCVNFSGKIAQDGSVGVKFRQVKAKRQKRTKRPQDAWGF